MTSIPNQHEELQGATLNPTDLPIANGIHTATIAVEPDNSAYYADLSDEQIQAAGAAIVTTEPEGGHRAEGQTPANKYGYDIFAGPSGKRLLDRILQLVLTYAAHRTWRYSDEYVAPGSVCYVGPHRLSEDIRPAVRKIEMDFKLLRDKKFMRAFPDYRLVKQRDGQFHLTAVIVKDFTALYDAAYAYYLWELSPNYIPPLWEYKELILADKELTERLRRYDAYRRIIECRQPGRKPVAQEEPTYEELVALHAADDAERALTNTPGTDPKEILIAEKKTPSPNRESRNHKPVLKRNSTSNPEKKEEFIGRTAIGNANNNRSTQPGSGTNRDNQAEIPSKMNPPTQKETGRETAKDVKYDLKSSKPQSAQEKAAAALAEIIPPEHLAQLNRQIGGQAGPRIASKALARHATQPRWPVPEWLVREIAKQAQELGDNPKVLGSVISRATKISRTAIEAFGLDDPLIAEGTVRSHLSAARRRTDQHIRGIAPDRRMAYMMECFINGWQFSSAELLFLESEESLYRDTDLGEYVDHLERSHERSGIQVDFEVWCADRLDTERTKKRQKRQQNQQRRQ